MREHTTGLTFMPDGTMRDAKSQGRNAARNADQPPTNLMDDMIDSLMGWSYSKQWYLFDPTSTSVSAWDSLTAAILIYIATFTPFEVAFLDAPTSATEPLFIVGRIVDAIFILDMILQFFMMVRAPTHPCSAPGAQ